MFKGRELLIATKHEKEKVMAPILEKELEVKCFVTSDFDTDELGTFTGEIERKHDPVTTARTKCLRAMEAANCDLAVASEGSFGPHPTLFFVSADDEFLLFMDRKNKLEIIVRELSTETNFNASEIKTEKDLNDFAVKANFPSHGLILRKSKDNFEKIVKGITNSIELKQAFNDLITNFGTAYVETDMRAMFNPTRLKVIERLTLKLAEKINSQCPECKAPGFGITEAQQGLPCERCHFPTRSTLNHIYGCDKCAFTLSKKYPHGKQTENPMYCDACNP
ncbi:MAG: hypothetical protein EBS09_06645 [Flavobacteriia bacterium]|nr:hypothetical protein [Flavobacteriia bacterium]